MQPAHHPEFPPYGQTLAPYACDPAKSRGRLHAESESGNRSPYQRDRDRIIHSTAFRRLEYKTQVFVNHEGDHYRTRLTHTLEVSQMARSISRSLGLNEDLAEAIALAHDLGHPPFGHAGEEALDETMRPYGGFDHNAHTLRLLTHLEQRYAEFDGLNLTWETLEGIAKHNGPLDPKDLPPSLAHYNKAQDLELTTYASAEAQIASLADDIAYNNHDIDDGIRAGLFVIEQLETLPLFDEVFHEVRKRYPNLTGTKLTHETVRRLINRMVQDLLQQTTETIRSSGAQSPEEIRKLNHPVARFSAEVEQANRALKAFLMKHMYRHYKVNRMSSKAKRTVQELFAFFHREPNCLPTAWQPLTDGAGTLATAKTVSDFIAGMTDRFALEEHARLFDMTVRM